MNCNYSWNRPLRMVRKLSGILALSAIGALFTTNADAQYCNTATTNVAITPTTVSQNTTSYNNGRRAFNFTTVAGRTYTFATCGLTSSDTYLRLYSTGTGGTVLASDDDGCGSQSTISYTETVSATRSILVTNYSCAILSAATQVSYLYSAGGGGGGCTSSTSYQGGAVAAPGGSVTLTTCAYGGEYSPATGLVAGNTYTITGSGGTGNYLTIQTSTGVFIQAGLSPQVLTGYTGAIRVIVHVNSACATDATCHTLAVATSSGAPAGCTNTTLYQTFAAPAPGAGPYTITTAQYQSEYNSMTGAVAGNTFTSTGSIAGTYITVHAGTYNGTIVAAGTTPLAWTATAGGSYFIHYNTNSACGTASVNMTTTITNTTPVAGSCLTATNGQYPAATATPTCSGVPVDVAAGCGYASEYTVMNLTSGVNYIFTSSVATDWITISNGAGTTALVFGTGPVNYTPTTTTTYRFYTHTNSACGAESVCRLRNVQCGTPPPVPTNNDCANAFALTVGATGSCPASATAGTTLGATGGAAPYPSCLVAGLVDVWYSFNSGANTSVQFNIVLGTMTVRAIQVLSACGGTETYCLPDQSSGTFPVTASTNYRLRILTTTGGAGTFSICLQSPPPPPANDACANATVVNTYPYASPVINNLDATDDYTAASSCDGPYKNVWWKVSGVCGTMSAKTCTGNTNFDTEMAVFSGSCGTFTAITCNDDGGPASCSANQSSVTWTATQGTDYYIAVGSYYSNYITGNLQLNVTVVDGDGDGTGDVCDLCPSDPNKIAPGQCGCGNPDADTDGDLTADCNDLCPSDPNKIAPGTCGCGVADNDTDGDLTADCNDLCPNDPNKIAPGICGCGVTDVDTDGDLTVDCNDGCPNDPNKIAPGNCGCGNPEPGASCDDGNPNTINDIVLANCTCAGATCTTDLVLEFQNATNPGQVTWQVRSEDGTAIIQSGTDVFPANSIGTQAFCLPDGCYRLSVTDNAGDGITGYALRETGMNGSRIIDNTGNMITGTSAISGGGTFCLPMGDVDLIYSSCDKMDWVNFKYMVCHADAQVAAEWVPSGADNVQDANSGYEFWIFDPNGTYSFRKFHPHNQSQGYSPATANRAARLKINDWSNTSLSPWIPEGVKMNVRVRGRVNGVNKAFGPACTMMLNTAAAACPVTNLQNDPSNTSDFSCGVTRNFGGTNSNANKIVANPPQFLPVVQSSLVRYQFRFRLPAEGVCIVRPVQTSPTLYLNWSAASGPQLQASKTYEVEVRASKDQGATWCAGGSTPACDPTPATWGKACNVTIGTVVAAQGGSSNMTSAGNGTLTMFPNPNNGDQLTISLNEVARDVRTMSVDIYDLTGKRITARTIAVQDGFVTTVLDLNNEIANGLYMVNITAGEKTYTERLVIQK